MEQDIKIRMCNMMPRIKIRTFLIFYQLSFISQTKDIPQVRSAPDMQGTILHLTIFIENINYQPNQDPIP